MPGCAGEVSAGQVRSPDGTLIAFDRSGTGPAVVLVHGAFTDRTHPTLAKVAAALAPWFTVINYDRRGRGGSGDTEPYALLREVEDVAAVIGEAGGSAMVFGGSSGAALAIQAAARNPAISRLALWEPPYHVDASAPTVPPDFAQRLTALVKAGQRGDAVEMFMTQAAQVHPEAIATMRVDPSWAAMEAIAPTLAYEAAVLGPGNALPTAVLAAISQPTLVLTGGSSPGWLTNAGRAAAAAIPGARQLVLGGQTHNVSAEALVPELLGFFA